MAVALRASMDFVDDTGDALNCFRIIAREIIKAFSWIL